MLISFKPENKSFKDWLEKIQYKAAQEITGAIRDTSRELIYNEHGLDCQVDKLFWVRLNNRVDWKFSGYLISEGVLINEGNGKSEKYVSVVNVKKRI